MFLASCLGGFVDAAIGSPGFSDGIDPTAGAIKETLEDSALSAQGVLSALRAFYIDRSFTPAWIQGGNPVADAVSVRSFLASASEDGLDPHDYLEGASARAAVIATIV